MRPRYHRARQSHCLYTRDWHLYVFPFARTRRREQYGLVRVAQSGLTVKHRREDGTWRHVTFRAGLHRDRSHMLQVELVTHLSEHVRSQRVGGTKRYLRFKVRI